MTATTKKSATGRRKTATARVYLRSGKGKLVVNGYQPQSSVLLQSLGILGGLKK